MQQESLEVKAEVEADGMQNADCGMRNIKSQYIELNTQVKGEGKVEIFVIKSIY